MGSETCATDSCPESVVNGLTKGAHGGNRDERNQRDEQGVLEKILTFVVPSEPFDGDNQVLHVDSPDSRQRTGAGPPGDPTPRARAITRRRSTDSRCS